MAFLDNSGDIILDAVLTDTGRMRLARGDGSFRITKFALGDDEINYENYNKLHASGSAYYDLEILQSPVLEAFTNNASSMKSHCISISRTDLLYLPIIKINSLLSNTEQNPSGAHMVACDLSTETAFAGGSSGTKGLIYGASLGTPFHIRLDQGIDGSDDDGNPVIAPSHALDADLVETQYQILIDNRLGNIRSNKDNMAKVSFIDDDNIASYYLNLGTDLEFVTENTVRDTLQTQAIAGPRGTILSFGIQASLELNTSTYLFNKLGSTLNMVENDGTTVSQVRYIDSIVRIKGSTTGYTVDVPVRFIKKV